MTNSTNLGLPYLAAGQAQKHVTVNEGLRRLDAIVQLAVESATTTAQPGSPADGQVWIVPSGKSGAQWGAMANWSLGYYRDGAWEEIVPREGWLAWVKDTDQLRVFNAGTWSVADLRTALGLGTAALVADNTLVHLAGAETITGAKTFTSNIFRDGAAGTSRDINFTTGGVGRLTVRLNADAESGANAGSNLQIIMRDDAGGIAHTFQVFRSTGILSCPGDVRPGPDNTRALGSASNRWSEVFAGNGTINTSDAREKTPLRPLSDAERRAVRRVMAGVGVFQWLASVAAKGADPAQGGARLHAGVTAQAVRDAFAEEGLDAAHYGLYCADPVVAEVEIAPARIERVTQTGPDGGEAEEEIDHPAVTELRPVIDPETGGQLVRLGVRHDQLFAMALAVLFAGEG